MVWLCPEQSSGIGSSPFVRGCGSVSPGFEMLALPVLLGRGTRVGVTGASGYLASHLVRELLRRGCSVRGTVLDPDSSSHDHIRRMAAESSLGSLELFQADLLDADAFDSVFAGVDCVFHTASPFFYNAVDPQKQLIEPALQGAKNVLHAAGRCGVKKVVMTSSMTACYEHPANPSIVYDESYWNQTATIENGQAYFVSKRLAEKEAWKIVEAEYPSMQLVTILPSLIAGPILNTQEKKITSTSVHLFSHLLVGEVNKLMFGYNVVDVRDCADAHLRAMESDKANGRYCCHGHSQSVVTICSMLKSWYPDNELIPQVEDLPQNGVLTKINNQKIQRDLNISFRSVEDTFRDMLNSLDSCGLLPQAPTA